MFVCAGGDRICAFRSYCYVSSLLVYVFLGGREFHRFVLARIKCDRYRVFAVVVVLLSVSTVTACAVSAARLK